jgi:acetyl esterase/lipase
MTISQAERRIRSGLPIIRFFQRAIPLPVANWLNKQGCANVKLDPSVNLETINADGVACQWIIPQNTISDQVLLYLHGGGFVFGQTPLHLMMGTYLALKMGVRILMVDYRTAPQYPFPAALDDCETAYLWLIKQGFSPQNIVVAGDSAGGNLTLTMLMKLRDKGKSLPAAAACLSPVTDLTPKDNLRPNFKDPLLLPKAIKFYRLSYIGKSDPKDPLISPVFGSLENFPPLLVHVGEDEILRDDAIRITELARSAGVDARLEIYPRMWHVWQINLALPQAIQSLDDISNFFKEHLAPLT